ncbi:VanZ family protein [Bacillus mycoides]
MLIDFDGFILIGAFIIWLFLLLFFKLHLKKRNMYLLFFSIFYLYLCVVLNYTQFPIIIDENMKKEIGQNVWRDANFIPFNTEHFAITTSLLNILLTIPFGFGFPYIKKTNFKQVVLSGIVLGFLLENLQLLSALYAGFTFRYVDINDVIFNCMGVILGYGISKSFTLVYRTFIHKLDIKLNSFLRYIYETNNSST